MDKYSLIQFANKLHKQSPCPYTRKELKQVLIYAFNPKSQVEQIRDKLAFVVSGEHLLTNK